jgi:hypothetical protein
LHPLFSFKEELNILIVMGTNKKPDNKSRRQFFSLWLPGSEKETPPDRIKMLTPDGKLVEVDKNIFDEAVKKKAGKKEIFDWMKNPSKENE